MSEGCQESTGSKIRKVFSAATGAAVGWGGQRAVELLNNIGLEKASAQAADAYRAAQAGGDQSALTIAMRRLGDVVQRQETIQLPANNVLALMGGVILLTKAADLAMNGSFFGQGKLAGAIEFAIGACMIHAPAIVEKLATSPNEVGVLHLGMLAISVISTLHSAGRIGLGIRRNREELGKRKEREVGDILSRHPGRLIVDENHRQPGQYPDPELAKQANAISRRVKEGFDDVVKGIGDKAKNTGKDREYDAKTDPDSIWDSLEDAEERAKRNNPKRQK